MRTAVILNGSSQSITRQAEELNRYIVQNFAGEAEIEAWVLSDQKIETSAIAFSQPMKRIKWVQVRTMHVAEEYLAAITKLYESFQPQIMIFGSELFVAGLAVRAAYRLQGSSCVGVRSSRQHEGTLMVEKLVYSNNLTAQFIMRQMPFCISVAKGFRDDPAAPVKQPEAEELAVPAISMDWLQSYRLERVKTDGHGLNDADIVVAAGKGIGSKEKIALFEELAGLLGGRLGASRPVVMNAWAGMEQLIGASGCVISPDVCIAVGVSGAAAFAVGIEKSKLIVAINKDKTAPIFKIADVAICCEYREVIDELIKLLQSGE